MRTMLLHHRLAESGQWIFRWRSYALFVFLPMVAISLPLTEHVELAFGGSVEKLYALGCIFLVGFGNAVRAATVGFVPAGTSGRNTAGQVAHVLNVTGFYSLSRNPLYLANCIIYMGLVLFTQDVFLSITFLLFLIVYYERIILAEEAFLDRKFGEEYRAWAERVPAFFPAHLKWRRPDLSFSVRTVLRREYPGWFASVFAMAMIEIAGDLVETDPRGWVEAEWIVPLTLGGVVCFGLRMLKKRTRLLRVRGR